EELAAAKSYLTGSFPLSLDRTGRLADLLVAMQRHGLAAEYLDQRQDLINSVTLEQVNRVAKQLLQPSRMIWSVVGQPDKITPTLEAPEAG
ncbi:MAG: hypothetical protein MI861_10865, partial [Pirellulales bacterium]|nr:hypothetical protein [Pirellulales bacterium]